MTYRVLRALTRAAAAVVLAGRVRVEGRELVPRSGPLLVCCNHVSTLDPVLVPAYLPRADSWSLGKAEYFAPGARFGWLFRAYHGFPVTRHSADRAALRRALGILGEGGALCIYPEGTRRGGAGLARPEPGAGFLALKSGAAVLPVAISGTERVLPQGAWWPRPAAVTIRFGQPLNFASRGGTRHREDYQEAADRIMIAVAGMLPAEQRGVFSGVAPARSERG